MHPIAPLVAVLALMQGAQAPPPPSEAMPPKRATPQAVAAVTQLAHVEERGSGPVTLILVPGLSCDWRVFDSFLERNRDRYRMFAVTLPGFGGSAPPPIADDATPSDAAWLNNAESAILQLVDRHKLKHAVIVGHSMGGHLATRMAVRCGDRLGGTVAIDGLPLYPPPQPGQPDTPETRASVAAATLKRMRAMPMERWAASQAWTFQSMVTDPERARALAAVAAQSPPSTAGEYMAEMMVSDLRPRMGSIRIPSLTIAAVSKEMGPEDAAKVKGMVEAQFKDASPSVQLVTLEDTRHFIMDDRPQELDRVIAEFVGGRRLGAVDAPAGGP
jgi:pimeloyl-ACP methyl ester carboxylesterase